MPFGAQLLEKQPEALGCRRHDEFLRPQLGLLLRRHLASIALVADRLEHVACDRYVVPTHHEHRGAWRGCLQLRAVLVEHRSDSSRHGARDDGIASLERAPLDDHRRHGATANLELALDDGTDRFCCGIGLELLDLGDERYELEQVVDACAVQRRDLGVRHVATELLDDDVVLRQGSPHRVCVCPGQIHLVDCHDDGDTGCLGVVDRLGGLRHHPVVGRHHEDHDVGDIGASSSQRSERLMAWGVDERDLLPAGGASDRPRCAE